MWHSVTLSVKRLQLVSNTKRIPPPSYGMLEQTIRISTYAQKKYFFAGNIVSVISRIGSILLSKAFRISWNDELASLASIFMKKWWFWISSKIFVRYRLYTPAKPTKIFRGEFMTNEQRDDLITELTLYSPTQIKEFIAEYQRTPKRHDCDMPFYEFLKEKLEIEGYWKKIGLAW
jgi:hypothetical protein